MKILLMMERRVNAGSIQAVASYMRAADELGHTLALYGQPDPVYPELRCSTDVRVFDRVLMIAEFSLRWMTALRMLSVLSQVPRDRRAILDTDGMYNAIVSVDDYDRNHPGEYSQTYWITHADALACKVLQPTLEPLEARVLPLPFYGYDTQAQSAHRPPPKRFDIVHVGHNWWRWREVSGGLLPAFEQVKTEIDGICFVGQWWGELPDGARESNLEMAFDFDSESFERAGIQVRSAVPYTEVISAMSEGRVNIMTQRPLFRHLKLLTSKYFEIFVADTIPLVMLDADHAASVYGPAGRDLALHGDVAAKLIDALTQTSKYRKIVQEVRQYLTMNHSYSTRMKELVEAMST